MHSESQVVILPSSLEKLPSNIRISLRTWVCCPLSPVMTWPTHSVVNGGTTLSSSTAYVGFLLLLNKWHPRSKKKKYLVSSNYKHLLHFLLVRNLGTASASASGSRGLGLRLQASCWPGLWFHLNAREGTKSERQFTFMLPDVVTGKSLFLFLQPNSQHGSHRKNDQREKRTRESEKTCNSSWKPQFFSALISELTSHHFSAFALHDASE